MNIHQGTFTLQDDVLWPVFSPPFMSKEHSLFDFVFTEPGTASGT